MQQGFIVYVYEDCIGYSKFQANDTTFIWIPTGYRDYDIRNNWELNTFSPIQELIFLDFANVKSNILFEIYGTLAEYMDGNVLMYLENDSD